jgi:hypothetical protein
MQTEHTFYKHVALGNIQTLKIGKDTGPHHRTRGFSCPPGPISLRIFANLR